MKISVVGASATGSFAGVESGRAGAIAAPHKAARSWPVKGLERTFARYVPQAENRAACAPNLFMFLP